MALKPPTTADALMTSIVRSGLLTKERLETAVQSAPTSARHNPERLAEYLVLAGYLSSFQAEKLLTGVERGLVLGPYHILASVGRGGMGAVYLARDARDQRLVALKVLPPQRYRHEERHLARFQREMEICQKVNDPHITRTFEAGVLNNVYYIAMEYVPGVTVKRRVDDGGALPIGRAARLFSEVSGALAHAHAQGLIHRDLKPGNIMITPNGHAKVLDFGLALIEGEEPPSDKAIVGGKGYVVGTMDFIAPEQVLNPTGVDARADLYSLGCSLYYVLTGQAPFSGGSSQQKIRRHLNEMAAPITDLNPTIPAGFAKMIEQLMAKKPEQRLNNAEDVRRFLLYWAGDEPELPMDVAVDCSNPREMIDLPQDQSSVGSFWESVPVQVFVGRHAAPRATAKTGEDAAGSVNWFWILLGVLAGLGLFLFSVFAIVLVLVLRK